MNLGTAVGYLELDTSKFQKEMLVYKGSVELTTKQYDEAIKQLNEMLRNLGN